MVKHKFFSRLKAAVVCAAMVATSVAVPITNYSSSLVSAEVQEIKSLPLTLVADGVKDGPRQANIALTGDLKRAKKLLISLSTSVEAANIGVYGFGISKDPYWVDCDFSEDIKGSTTIEVPVPADAQGIATKVGIGVWYPKDGSEVTIKSIEADGLVEGPAGAPGGGSPEMPVSENDKSGTYTFQDNGDGTATITATLSAQYKENDKTEFDIPLSQGWDEEKNYAPFKNPTTGEPFPEWKEGDPINSHKFKFTGFGIDDLESIDFQSFEYVVESKDYNMDDFQYGGGISVEMGSPADTEYAIGKDGYWYNDHGDDELETYASAFQISDVHGAYKASNCGNYAKLAWDVPKSVQPWIDYSNSFNSVGFQYWWGVDNSKTGTATNEAGEEVEVEYAVIPEVTLKSCIATYTRKMIVPYNETVKGTGSSLAAKGNLKFDLSTLNLGKRDKLSAVKFSFDSKTEMQKFVGGVGVSVTEDAQSSFIESEGWYQPGDVCVINNGPKFDVMIAFPENIRNGIWGGKGGNIQLGYYYGDKEGGETIPSVSVTGVDYYIFRSQEQDLKLTDKDGMEIPDRIELEVGDEYPIKTNVNGCEYTSTRPNVASVDDNGVIHALEEGLTVVTVKTPEGQEKDITVIVKDKQEPTEPFDPEKDIDWDKVIWGDVNVDGSVDLVDVVVLSQYLLSNKAYPLKNATARENAQCKYDGIIDIADNSKLIEYNLGAIKMDNLGPSDPEIRKKATWYQKHGFK